MGAWLGAHRADEAANEEEKDFGRALDASRDNNDKHGAGQASGKWQVASGVWQGAGGIRRSCMRQQFVVVWRQTQQKSETGGRERGSEGGVRE